MSYRLREKESVQNGTRRVISEQIERALAELADDQLDRSHVIHQVRKRCKKIRGALRLVRDGIDIYGAENGSSTTAITCASCVGPGPPCCGRGTTR